MVTAAEEKDKKERGKLGEGKSMCSIILDQLISFVVASLLSRYKRFSFPCHVKGELTHTGLILIDGFSSKRSG